MLIDHICTKSQKAAHKYKCEVCGNLIYKGWEYVREAHFHSPAYLRRAPFRILILCRGCRPDKLQKRGFGL